MWCSIWEMNIVDLLSLACTLGGGRWRLRGQCMAWGPNFKHCLGLWGPYTFSQLFHLLPSFVYFFTSFPAQTRDKVWNFEVPNFTTSWLIIFIYKKSNIHIKLLFRSPLLLTKPLDLLLPRPSILTKMPLTKVLECIIQN
jgi:hypothetical protein